MTLSLPSWAWYLIGLLLLVLGIYIYGRYEYHEGVMSVKIVEARVVANTAIESGKVTSDIIPKFETQVQYIRGATLTISKEVPIYVTQQDDSRCIVPNGFVSLWNATNKMQLPNNSAGVPAGASSVVLSDIAAQHGVEAGICHENEARLTAMKGWLLEQQRVYSGH